MSKRFGRNQKRKLQKELAWYKLERVVFSDMHNKVKNQLDRMMRILPQNFVGADPIVIPFERNPNFVVIPCISPEPICIEDPIAVDAVCNQLEIQLMETKVTPYHDCIHVEVRNPYTNKLKYGITRSGMECMPKDLLIEQISYELGRMLVEEFTGVK